jgi:outer membrane lipoprotein-sorting protein
LFSISRRHLLRTLGTAGLVAASQPIRIARAAPPGGPPTPAPAKPIRLTDQQRVELMQVQDYLNSIRTLSSRFSQVTPDMRQSQGQIYLSRPGRMRIEYDPPVPVLLVADGNGSIYYYDRELQQVTDMRANDTPAGFLLSERISLTGDLSVSSYEHNPGAIRVGLFETKEAGQGSVTMVLDDKPLQLRQWTVVDSQHKQVTVTLDNPHYGVTLDPKLFYWTDPRPSSTGR